MAAGAGVSAVWSLTAARRTCKAAPWATVCQDSKPQPGRSSRCTNGQQLSSNHWHACPTPKLHQPPYATTLPSAAQLSATTKQQAAAIERDELGSRFWGPWSRTFKPSCYKVATLTRAALNPGGSSAASFETDACCVCCCLASCCRCCVACGRLFCCCWWHLCCCGDCGSGRCCCSACVPTKLQASRQYVWLELQSIMAASWYVTDQEQISCYMLTFTSQSASDSWSLLQRPQQNRRLQHSSSGIGIIANSIQCSNYCLCCCADVYGYWFCSCNLDAADGVSAKLWHTNCRIVSLTKEFR